MRYGPVGSLYLEFYLGFSTWAELQFSASSSGGVHNNFPTCRNVIVYDHDDGLAVFEVRHSDTRAHRYRAMRRGQCVRIVALTTGGSMPNQPVAIACGYARFVPFLRWFLRR